MDQPRTIQSNLDQDDEEVLGYTVADEALEAAAGTDAAGRYSWQFSIDCFEC